MWNLRGRGPRGPLDYGSVRGDAYREVMAMREFPGKDRADGVSPARRWGRGGSRNRPLSSPSPRRERRSWGVLGARIRAEQRKWALYWLFDRRPALAGTAVTPVAEGLAYNSEPLEMHPKILHWLLRVTRPFDLEI